MRRPLAGRRRRSRAPIIRMRSPAASAMAPPEPPSPMMVATMGTGASRQASMERAMASAWPCAPPRCRIGARGVNEGQDRQMEAAGQFDQAAGLAVALGPGHAEIMGHAGFGIVALLGPDDDDWAAVEAPQPADDGRVLAERAVARERGEVGDERPQVVQRLRPGPGGGRRASSAGRQPRIGGAELLVALSVRRAISSAMLSPPAPASAAALRSCPQVRRSAFRNRESVTWRRAVARNGRGR